MVRVRFAPSPTGPLHIGGVRTALYNYLFARKNNGKFILRIEDTDRNRYVPGAEQYIIEALKWCGLNFDESIETNGEFGPYRQSERKEIYKKHIDLLIKNGKAYYAFDTPAELDEMRKRLVAEKSPVQHYNYLTRSKMRNSFTLEKSEVDDLINNGVPYVVRFNMPENKNIVLKDIIRGEIHVNTSTLDDKILFKSDGMPTYHLANVVDDHLMRISHVIRGEEWLPSLALHVLLYEAFGWEPPQFAHLPLILKPDGKGKLSKRDGDRLGFPVFPIQWKDPKTGEISAGYREAGYLPEAFVNMLAFIGWNPGTDEEIYSLDELAELFSLEKVNKSGARFDPEKAKWFNHQYLKMQPVCKLADEFMLILKQKNIKTTMHYAERVVELVRDRVNFVHELWDAANFFFVPPEHFDKKAVKKYWKDGTVDIIKKIINILEQINHFYAPEIETTIKNFIQENELPTGKVLNAIRLSLVGSSKGPHLFTIIEMLGKQETINRLQFAIDNIKK